jgi:RimJ/RimL family protein N-acetyltransferase
LNPQPILETNRLILRPFNLNDAKTAQTLAGDKQIAATTLTIPHPYEDGMAEYWINTHIVMYNEGKSVIYAITLKETDELVGAISLANIVENHQAELGYWVGVPYWNKGYCTEAGKTLLRYGFVDRGLNRVHARYLSRNPSSGRVLEKLGMVHEGTRKQHILKWGEYEDLEMMGVLKSDWEKTR